MILKEQVEEEEGRTDRDSGMNSEISIDVKEKERTREFEK